MDASVRASDADREAAAQRLRRGMGEGRLTVEELEERLEAAYRARTGSELARLVADLPAEPPGGPAASPPAGAGVPVRAGPGGTSWIVSVMSAAGRRGRWRLARRCLVINVMGSAHLDLSAVELAADRVDLTVFSVMGDSRIIVPASLTVEVSRFALMGGDHVDLGDDPTPASGPVLRLRLLSIMGSGEVRRAGESGRLRRGRRRRSLGPGGR